MLLSATQSAQHRGQATLYTAPTSEPLTLQEALDHLRLEVADDNAQVNMAIASARQHLEENYWRGIVTQTWDLTLNCFPPDACWPVERQGIELPRGNLNSVAHVKYIDPDGTLQTLAGTEYVVDTKAIPGRIRRAFSKDWPAHRAQWDAVQIRYVVGWAVASVPSPIKSAMLLLVGHFYENRVPEVIGATVTPLLTAVDALMRPYGLTRHT